MKESILSWFARDRGTRGMESRFTHVGKLQVAFWTLKRQGPLGPAEQKWSRGPCPTPPEIKPWVAFGLPYMLIEFFLYWCACGLDRRAVGRSGRRTIRWLPKCLRCMGYQIFLPMVLHCARFALGVLVSSDWKRHKNAEHDTKNIR